MKAAINYGPGDVRIEQISEPLPPGPDEVCLRVLTASMCGTDAGQYQVPSMIPLEVSHPASGHQGPLILGHEVCGIVEAKGEAVSHLAVGDRVAIGAGSWCGECPRCLEGRMNICEHYFVYGLHANGGLAERARFPAKMCVRVPAQCSDEAAALAQPLAVALHALARSQIRSEMTVAVFGVGGIGSLVLAALAVQPHLRPARLLAVDIDPARLQQASLLGADAAINAELSDVHQQVDHITHGEGVDMAIEATGQPATIAQALRTIHHGGRLLQVGIPREPVALPIAELVLQEKEVIASNGHICPLDMPAALNLLATTDLATRVGITLISLETLVAEGLLPLVEHRAHKKAVVRIN